VRVEALPGLVVVELEGRADERGLVMETFQHRRHEALGVAIGLGFVQDNLSSSRRGVVRGLHYQVTRPQGKLVHALRGEVFDVAVDLRRDSPAFGCWYGLELSGDRPRQLWIPPGCAHGFQALSEGAIVAYKLTASYDAADERALRWDDPDLGIDWPIRDGVVLSARDAAAPGWRDVELPCGGGSPAPAGCWAARGCGPARTSMPRFPRVT
jgi:dTDP-4-dehydrorhamnose 3,5-epimerase